VSFEKCHKGTLLCFTDPVSGVKVQGGGINREVEIGDDELTIALVKDSGGDIITAGFTPKFMKPRPRIFIPWDDYSIPNLTQKEWRDLVKEVRSLKLDVVVYCLGGHGRTGTALAILASLMGAPVKGNPVEFVRTKYCKNAIETEEQIEYIGYITGLNLSAEVKKQKKKDSASYVSSGLIATY